MRWNLFNRQKAFICAFLLCLSTSAWAGKCLDALKFKPYIGLEYQYEHIKPSTNYRNILSADLQTGNFFVGTKFFTSFGLEIGYYRTIKPSQQQDQVQGFGNQFESGTTALLTRTSFKGFSVDFSGYYALDPNFDISAIVGLVTMHPSMTFQATGGTNLAKAFPLIKAKNRTVPRLGMGLDLFLRHWGVRSRIFWVYTQDIRYNVTDAQTAFPGITNNPYVQAVMATAGIYYKF